MVHEVALFAYFFALPINSQAIQLLNFGQVKVATGLAAVLAVALQALTSTTSSRRIPSHFPRAWKLVIAYALALTLATLSRDLSSDRYILLTGFIFTVMAFRVCEVTRPGSFLAIVTGVSITHLIFAVVLNEHALGTTGFNRLTGGSHPILLGFESGVILCITLAYRSLAVGRRRFLATLVAALALYTLIASFSRTALIATSFGAMALFVWTGRKKSARLTRFAVSAIAFGVIFAAFGEPITNFLQQEDRTGFYTATGRVAIWSSLWELRSDFLAHGYGFGALQGSSGPDAVALLATGGQPAENALLNAALMAGLVGAVLLLLVHIFVTRDLWGQASSYAGFPVALAILLIASAVLSDGTSGTSYQWLWLLAAISLTHLRTEWTKDTNVATRGGLHDQLQESNGDRMGRKPSSCGLLDSSRYQR